MEFGTEVTSGFLRCLIFILGEDNSITPQRRWYSLSEKGVLRSSINPGLIDIAPEVIILSQFQVPDAVDGTNNFTLESKANLIEFTLTADSPSARENWIEAICKVMGKPRKKKARDSTQIAQPTPTLAIHMVDAISGSDRSPLASPSTHSLSKVKKLMSNELKHGGSGSSINSDKKAGPDVVYTVQLKICEAKISSGDTPDSFVVASIDDSLFRTKTVVKSGNPLWSEDALLKFQVPPKNAFLRVSLWEEHGKNESIVGKADISLSELVSNAPPSQDWYNLSYATNAGYVSGGIHIRFDSSHKDTIGVAFLTVIEGKHLALKTRSPCEVFVRVTMGKQVVKTHPYKIGEKSEIRKATGIDAQWNESIELKAEDGLGEINLAVMKAGIASSTCIGVASIKASSLPPAFDGWIRLEADPESQEKESSKSKDKVGDLRLSLRIVKAVVYPLEHYEPLTQLLMDADSSPNLISVFEKIAVNPEDRLDMATRLVHIYEAKNKAPIIIKLLLTHEIRAAPDVETLFRANSLASKAVDMYMKTAAYRYLQVCVQPTIDFIYKEAGRKSFEIDSSKLDKGDDAGKGWSRLKKVMDDLLTRIYESAPNCPANLKSIFKHLQSEVESKFSEATVRYTGVSSFLFLRFLVAAILGPKLFDLVPDHPSPKVSQNLTAVARVLQRIANMTPMDLTLKDYLREREFYIERHKVPMQQFIDSICVDEESVFDPVAVDLQEDLCFVQDICEKNIGVVLTSVNEGNAAISACAQKLLIALDKMAAASAKPRKPALLYNGTDWKVNPSFNPATDSKSTEDDLVKSSEDSSDNIASHSNSSAPSSEDRKPSRKTGSKAAKRSSSELLDMAALPDGGGSRDNSPSPALDPTKPRAKSKIDRML